MGNLFGRNVVRTWLFKLFSLVSIVDYARSGEAKWLIVFRGILAASLLVAMAGFAFFNLVLAPVIEGAMVPTKELRVTYKDRLPPDLHLSKDSPINVVVTVRDYPLTAFYRNSDIYFFRALVLFF